MTQLKKRQIRMLLIIARVFSTSDWVQSVQVVITKYFYRLFWSNAFLRYHI